MADDEHEGASIQERFIEACRRDNTDLLKDLLAEAPADKLAAILNNTTTVMGNHLYHEAACHGNYDIIDILLDQDDFECDPINRVEGDTPLHSAVRWINSEPPAQREFGNALVDMMLEAGSNPRTKNKGGLTPYQLVDPANDDLRRLIRQHEYAAQNAGDFVTVDPKPPAPSAEKSRPVPDGKAGVSSSDDDDAEFSGSDDDERAEWERRRKQKKAKGKR